MKFKERVNISTGRIHILQLNIGKICNLKCSHCHVEASPKRHEVMSRDVFDQCMKVYDTFNFDTIDITGGEPSIHPDIQYFIEESLKRCDHVIFRSNLVNVDARDDLLELLAKNNVHIVCSLPCYTKENVDKMRGHGVFDQVIRTIHKLNDLGYGDTLPLDLVYNPMGAFLPPAQKELQKDYQQALSKMGIRFSELLTITNVPIGYFKKMLLKEGMYDSYLNLLEDKFNEGTVEYLMCRHQISISFDGKVYDCDFNQMTNIPCERYQMIDDLLKLDKIGREIQFENYCYACTAGAGSSCGGSLNE